MLPALLLFACLLASVPAVNVLWNLVLYRPAPAEKRKQRLSGPNAQVSLLIPARDEENSIGSAVSAALASRGVDLEIVVMDDHSRDRTAEIVREIARRDSRVRLVSAPKLPDGWCGKQHACQRLAEQAEREFLVFVDSDVVLEPDAVQRMVAFLEKTGSDLASGIPRQRTETVAEKLVIPLIHFVLLGFLPLAGMRRLQSAAWAAGCGQLLIVRRRAYTDAGGHQAIRGSRHDGLMLPRAFRHAGKRTDLFDATDLASCRMYRSSLEVWNGFAKNATEGMASPTAILPWSVMLVGGQVVPAMLLVLGFLVPGSVPIAPALLGTLLTYGTRLVLAARFRQSPLGAALHPLGVLLVVSIQWFALARSLKGLPLVWKGRP